MFFEELNAQHRCSSIYYHISLEKRNSPYASCSSAMSFSQAFFVYSELVKSDGLRLKLKSALVYQKSQKKTTIKTKNPWFACRTVLEVLT